ncbi:MAG TPA: DUF5131 family protein [Elusimicrobiales bacterium]|nr:DUF5131 family protein [Elusimicrobiales bacterium]
MRFETWNPLAGACPHKCSYCYAHKYKKYPSSLAKYSGPLRLDEAAMEKKLGGGKFYFVCSMNDLFAAQVPREFIVEILAKTARRPQNEYLFHTKNPARLREFEGLYPYYSRFGVTLETDSYPPGFETAAPTPPERAQAFALFAHPRKSVNIEPVLDFDLEKFLRLLLLAAPQSVHIGRDSKNNKLPEPSDAKLRELKKRLGEYGIVYGD